jgi:hypothetical protein
VQPSAELLIVPIDRHIGHHATNNNIETKRRWLADNDHPHRSGLPTF